MMDHCVDHQSVFRGWSQASDPAQLCRGGALFAFGTSLCFQNCFCDSCHGNWEIRPKKFVYECAYMSAREKDKHEAYVCITFTICSYLHQTVHARVCV